jgi:hypothetical protein
MDEFSCRIAQTSDVCLTVGYKPNLTNLLANRKSLFAVFCRSLKLIPADHADGVQRQFRIDGAQIANDVIRAPAGAPRLFADERESIFFG